LYQIGDYQLAFETVVERKSKFTLIAKLDSNYAEGVTCATVNLLNHHPRKTLNYQIPHAVFFAENNRNAA
jgi:IS30 family transposase